MIIFFQFFKKIQSSKKLMVGLVCLLPFVAFSQTIQGSTNPCVGVTVNYTFDGGRVYVVPGWNISNGNLLGSSTNGTQYTATVQWPNEGAGSVSFKNKSTIISTLSINIYSVVKFNLSGGGSYCTGSAAPTITLSGSTVGVNYQKYVNGIARDAASPGTGGALSWANQTYNGNYVVIATHTATGCTLTMSGSPSVTALVLPAAFSMGGGGNYCIGGSGVSVTLSGSEAGVNYQLQLNGSNVGGIQAGSGGVISWNSQTAAGNYTAVAVNGSGCSLVMTGNVAIGINALPVAYTVSGGGAYCSGSTAPSVSLGGSQVGVSYQLLVNGVYSGSAIAGTASALTWTNQTTAGTYTVRATHASGCILIMSTSTTITVNSLPGLFTVTGGGGYCSGGTGKTVTLSSSLTTATTYQLQLDGVNTGAAVPGSGAELNWVNLTAAGTYTVVARITSTGCAQLMSGSAVIVISPLPTVFTVGGNSSYCAGGSGVAITLNGSQTGVNYQLFSNGSPAATIAGTGIQISWPNQTTAATYTIKATTATTLCQQAMSGSKTVVVSPVPSVPTAISSLQCGAGPAPLSATSGLNGNTIRWYAFSTGGAALAEATTYNPSISVTTTYYISTYSSTASCESPRVLITATVNSVPAQPIAAAASFCSSGILTATAGANASTVRWYSAATGGTVVATGLSSPSTAVTTTYYAVSFNSTTGCESPAPRLAVTATIYPKPVVSSSGSTVFTYGNVNTVALSTSAFNSYQWKKDGVDISAQTTSSYSPTTIGSYTVATKVSAGAMECTSASIIVSSTLASQPTPINYVSTTRIMKEGVTSGTSLYSLAQKDVSQVINYQDGIGRIFQSVAVGQSATQTDLVSPIAYGRQGLADSTFLPYATATKDGRFRLYSIRGGVSFQYSQSEQKQFYQNTPLVATDANPYARSVHRAAPDARVTEQGAPGTDWQPGTTHTVRNTKTINTAAYPVRYWKVNGTTTGNYPAGTLLVNITTDENNNQIRTFTNKQGQTVLKQVQLDEQIGGTTVNWLETYYIYDQFGRLTYQLPPKAAALNITDVADLAIAKLVYKYAYDSLGRVNEKTEPGAEVKYIVYDKLGRVALTQDGKLRASKQWVYVKYDQYNRPVYSGIYTNNTKVSRKAMQGLVSSINYPTQSYFETPANNAAYRGYTNNAFPTDNTITVLSAAYYDGYDFNQDGTADFTYDNAHLVGLPASASTNTRNLPTGSSKVIIGTSTWLTSAIFYDQYDRTLQTQSNNHLNTAGIDKTSVLYLDLVGHVDKTKTTHAGPASTTVTVQQRYTYDPNWRTLGIYHSINGATEQQLVSYTYNILGQVVDKKLHANGANFLQSVDMRYNIRGWLKSINNASLDVNSANNDDSNDYFGMELSYNTAETNSLGNTLYYNGNVSAAKWKGPGLAAGSVDQRSYKYVYDKSDKLKSATFQANTGATWTKEASTLDETMTYDHNGNILTLLRNQNLRGLSGTTVTSVPEAIDNLTYNYTANSNQMLKVEDAVATTVGVGDFKDGPFAATEYTYTADGSMNQDLNKGIQSITYNVLGKPEVVTYNSAKMVTYTYDAAGSKLKTVTLANGVTTTTDYIGGFVYTNNTLSFFSSPEGRVVKSGANYEYQYAIADHQGNTRVLFTSAPTAPQANGADMEAASNASFSNYTNRVGFDLFDHTDAGTLYNYAQKLTGATNAQVGLTKSFKVYAGDKVKIEAYAKYWNASSTPSNLSGFALALTNAFGVTAGSTGEALKAFNTLTSYGSLVAGGGGHSNNTTAPIVGVTILLFDKDFKLIDATWKQLNVNSVQVGATPKAPHEYLSSEYVAREAGYAYMYVSNDSPTLVEAYFDDVVMTYTPGNIVQYNEYYPFGLQTATSWTRENSTGNNFLYNGGTELNTTTGVMDLFYRNYDPVLGRMNQVDPMASKYASQTPYNYAFNSPVMFSDPMGDDPDPKKPKPKPTTKYDPSCSQCGIVDTGTFGMVIFEGRLINPRGLDGRRSFTDQMTYGFFMDAVNGRGSPDGITVNGQPLSSYPVDASGRYITSGGYLENENHTEYEYFIDGQGNLRRTGTVIVASRFVPRYSHGQRNRDAFVEGFLGPDSKTNFLQADNFLGFANLALVDGFRLGALIERAGTNGVTAVARLTGLLNGAKALGQKIGVAGAVLTAIDGALDGNFSAGDLAKVGLGVLTAFSPFGWAYAAVDLGVGLATGTSLTDRIGYAVDSVVYEMKRN